MISNIPIVYELFLDASPKGKNRRSVGVKKLDYGIV